MRTNDFDYQLTEEAIAQVAIEPRDSARLLVVRGMGDRVFSDLPELLAAGDLLVVNRTRVRAARLRGRRVDTGGAVEVLLLRRVDPRRWEAMIRPARRMRPGVEIDFGELHGNVLSDPRDGIVALGLTPAEPGADFNEVERLVAEAGEMPLPPYFHGALADPDRYQTVFAQSVGSAAAPTAALHFTPELIERLTERGVGIAEVELDVGLDTFRPISVDDVTDHVIHRERFRVPEEAAKLHAETRNAGGRIVAVGTTVVRTLETAWNGTEVAPGEGESGLFIMPGYEFKAVDTIITNFHAPRTTLISLIATAIGSEWRTVYETAIERGYRFLSFGDSMIITDVGKGAET